MIRNILVAGLAIIVLSFSAPAFAGMIPDTYSEASTVVAKMGTSKDYHSLLAKKLAMVAMEEVDQNDTLAARAFISLAHDEAAKAGGAK